MKERLKHIKENLMGAVESQMYNLNEADAEELGEVVDMIKDIEEALYYCAVVEAMDESKKEKEHEKMYYTTMMPRMYYNDRGGEHYAETRGYYSEGGNRSSSSGNGNNSSMSQYSEREFPHAFQDMREGRSPRSRRMYMEAKETKQDKAAQMRELEKYVQELTQDVVEMIEGSSSEERQYLSKRISALANKISQIND